MKRFINPCLLLLLVGTVSYAQEAIHPTMDATHTFLAGALWQQGDSEFYAETKNPDTPKKKLKLSDLGMDDTYTSWTAEYRYRINDKWMLSVGGYTFRTDGTIDAKDTFEYDGVEFEAGVKLDSSLDIDTYLVDILYKVYGNEKAQVFLGGGFHVSKIATELKASVFVDEEERNGQRAGDDLLAPLPNLRMQGAYAFSSKWLLSGTVGWLSMNYDDYDGSFAYISGRLSYNFTEHFGLGVGYQYLDLDFNVQRNNGDAGVGIQFNGPSAFLSYSF